VNAQQGTISLWVGDRNRDWWHDGKEYQFAGFQKDGISLEVAKLSVGTLEATIGLYGKQFIFRAPTPKPREGPDGYFVSVSIMWIDGMVKFFLNGAPLAEAGIF
jgi:hypothetical protein